MYGLIGRPLGHSFSANFFNEKFRREGIDEEYRLFPLDNVTDLSTLLTDHPDLHGLNVTIPYKQEVIPLLDDISEEAREIGAVNVIKIETVNGKRWLKGFNSDIIGFTNSLSPMLGDDVKSALVLGTGGASKAVCYALRKLGLEVVRVSRSRKDGVISYEDVTPEVVASNLLIVNTTPLGMWPDINAAPDIPYDSLTSRHILFDLVYNPETTEFMKQGIERGASVKNGLEMLYGQALAAWEIWTH